MTLRSLPRRHFLALATGSLARAQAPAQAPVTRPEVSEQTCPLEPIQPVAQDGYKGRAFLRKPPGNGRMPAIVWIHGGLRNFPEEGLRRWALGTNVSRFLAAGYAVCATTYRSRDHDPQTRDSVNDCLAAVDHLKRLNFVDSKSIGVFGCSGGGDLALEIAAASGDVCAISAEEPASFMFAGIFNASFPKKGELLTPPDSIPIGENPKRYYTPEYQKTTRAKIARIRCPILIVQGDQNWVVPFNDQVLIPEIRAAGKELEVLSLAGEPHCFSMMEGLAKGVGTRHSAALKAFERIDGFFRRHVAAKPKPMDPSLVKQIPV